ncbi:MAG: biotin transporter BioY [Treponema sp.]|nr:biotin transporter BioY [Treponema sp.]
MKNIKIQKNLILSALFAALISVGCFIQIPLPGGIPIAIQDMMAMLSGLLLGPVFCSLSVVIFLVLGVIGLPVFTGKAGIQILLNGPTSGFLWGYLIAAIVGGLFLLIFLPGGKKHSNVRQYVMITVAALLATVVLFACGIAGGMIIMKMSFEKTLAAYLIPFIPGNIIKIILMVLLTKKIRPLIYGYTH